MATRTITPFDSYAAELDESVIRAAGGVIVRTEEGMLEVAIVHRPHRSDWTFPKGKREVGETFEDCALREVKEETGFSCSLRQFIGHTDYEDRKGRQKVVAYWVMSINKGSFSPNDEVNALLWVDVETAGIILTYDRDREILASHLNETSSLSA